MSSAQTPVAEAMAALQPGRSGPAQLPAGIADPAAEAKARVFAMQLEMARRVLGSENAEEERESGWVRQLGGVGEARLLDALRRIASLTGEGTGPAAAAVKDAAPKAEQPEGMGGLSARFESGQDGVAAVGFDRTGGTSYGTYQISSKAGSLRRFIDFLDQAAPEWADRLSAAGPANTGSTRGKMPDVWRAIAAEDPARFERLQHEFIRREFYQPASERILEQTGIDFDRAPRAFREVLWSTSVQHGPSGAARIFADVIQRFAGTTDDVRFGTDLIRGVYRKRETQFSSSTPQVQGSVKGRLAREKDLALAMLERKSLDRMV
jgi:hypothetical protein